MDISQIIKQTKNIILKELFTDINDKCCVLDLCIENKGKDIKISQWDATKGDFFTLDIQSLSKVSQFFFEKMKSDLINEYNNETILPFRKHNYEKILNQYLENRYGISNLEFSIIISEKEKKKLEHKSKQELKERNKEEQIKKQIKKQEDKLIKNIENFNWNKSIEANCIKYLATDKNGKNIEIQYIPNNQEKTDSVLLYDNQPLKYANYNINVLVDIIEKNIKDKLKSELKQKQTFENNIIQKLPYLTWKKTIKIDYITYTSTFKEKQITLNFYGVKKFNKNILLYDNQPLKFVKYNINKIVNIIEESIKQNKPMLTEIGLKDFVVRTNVFKCMHNKHKIDNIVAMINIDNDGKREQIKISAGYCNECKVYFMLNSTYQALKNKGLILCRITDEKSYLKGNYANGIRLAKESILMQYGYNTSQTNGLSATGRQKILAVIIDNKIMSKSEIISYLDFFINQRSSQARMELAISKWETDREFVENYKIGQYTQFGVNAIYRR